MVAMAGGEVLADIMLAVSGMTGAGMLVLKKLCGINGSYDRLIDWLVLAWPLSLLQKISVGYAIDFSEGKFGFCFAYRVKYVPGTICYLACLRFM